MIEEIQEWLRRHGRKNILRICISSLLITATIIIIVSSFCGQFSSEGRNLIIAYTIPITIASSLGFIYKYIIQSQSQPRQYTLLNFTSNFHDKISVFAIVGIICLIASIPNLYFWLQPQGDLPEWKDVKCLPLNVSHCNFMATLDIENKLCVAQNVKLNSPPNLFHPDITYIFNSGTIQLNLSNRVNITFSSCTFTCGPSRWYPTLTCGELQATPPATVPPRSSSQWLAILYWSALSCILSLGPLLCLILRWKRDREMDIYEASQGDGIAI